MMKTSETETAFDPTLFRVRPIESNPMERSGRIWIKRINTLRSMDLWMNDYIGIHGGMNERTYRCLLVRMA